MNINRLRARMGRRGGGKNRRDDDLIMSLLNNRMRQGGRGRGGGNDGVAQQAIASILAGNPAISRGAIPSGARPTRRGTEIGTGRTSTRGNGRAYASGQPGTVDIGRVSSDTPPRITINGVEYVPDGRGGVQPAGQAPAPRQAPHVGLGGVAEFPVRARQPYNPPPPNNQRVGSTSAPGGEPYDTSRFIKPYPSSPGQLDSRGNPATPGNASYGRTFGADPRQAAPPIQSGERPPAGQGALGTSPVTNPNQFQTFGQGVAPTTNPKGGMFTPQEGGSQLGNRIADVVKRAIGLGAEQPTAPTGIRDLVNRRLMERGLIPDTPGNEWGQPQQQPQATQLPVIQAPTQLPGSAVTGQAPQQQPAPPPPATATGEVQTVPVSGPTTSAPPTSAPPTSATGAVQTLPVSGPEAAPAPSTTAMYGDAMPGAAEMDTITPAIDAASAELGVPGNVIKAVQTLETGGKPGQYIGQMNCDESIVGAGMGCLALTAGIHESTANNLGLDFNRIVNDPEYAAYATGVVLDHHYNTDAGIYDPALSGKTVGEVYGWEGAVSIYFSGKPDNGAWRDGLGRSTSEYLQDYYVYLDALGGEGAAATSAAPGLNPGVEPILGPDGQPLPVIEGPTEIQTVPGAERTARPASGPVTAIPTVSGGTNEAGATVGDGMGMMAQNPDESTWINTMFPDGQGYVSTDYKQNVCTYNPDCCNGGPDCWYDSNETVLAGASRTVHAGYDIGANPGTTFHAPMGGKIIGSSTDASNPLCISPAGTNECTWAADYGVVMDGGVDPQGNQIYINYDHVGQSYVDGMGGQYVEAGTPLGTVGDPAHIHVEVHAYCPAVGKMVALDPSLVYSGYYQSHSVCEGIA